VRLVNGEQRAVAIAEFAKARQEARLGEHNDEVLRERCGLTADDLRDLASSGVIGTRPKGL
jgi:hypothetical protein